MTDESSAPWIIRPYESGDEEGIGRLFERVHGRPFPEDQWRWKLRGGSSPGSFENIWVATLRRDLVFHYAGIPVRYRAPEIADGDIVVMIAVDAVTAPELRKRGLFKEAARRAHASWRKAGVGFVLGLPNDQYRPGALGWRPLFPLAWLVRPLRPEAAVARRLRSRVGGSARMAAVAPLVGDVAERLGAPLGAAWRWVGRALVRRDPEVHVRRLSGGVDELATLDTLASSGPTLGIVRDSRWVQWRYLAAPGAGYAVLLAERDGAAVGFSAFRLRTDGQRRMGVLAELFVPADDPGARATLLATTIDSLDRAGADTVATLATPRTHLFAMLRRAGFLRSWGAFQVSVIPLAPGSERLVEPPYAAADAWTVSGGDFDVV